MSAFRFTHARALRAPLAFALCAALAACDGDGDDGTAPVTPPAANGTAVSGILVSPVANATASALIMNSDSQRKRALGARIASTACPSVPDGYDPLANVVVTFSDASNASLATLTTDACGNFAGTVPSGVTTVTATPNGLIAISQPLSAFTGATPALVSGLPTATTLVISVLQDLGGGKIALTVTDSATGKAVLGLSAANFAFAIGGVAQTPSGVSYGSSTAQVASVGIVLDSSGSMSSEVGTTGKTAIQVASTAAHTLLDGLSSGGDQAGIVIFSSTIFTMNDATLASSRFSWADAAGAATAPYSFSATGLTTDIAKLRPIADMYNRESAIYLSNTTGGDPVNAATGNVRLSSNYALSGGTAFYDATSAGLTLITGGANARKIIVAMTDGEDNASSKSATTVIGEAVAAGVPLYMVAFGSASSVDETTMQKMATDTGGEYKRVEGIDLTGLFQSIQTGIRFQYLASFPAALTASSVLDTTVTVSTLTATRSLTIR